MLNWIVEPFQKDHERSAFSCGQPTRDDFIRVRVSQYEKRRLGKTYVAIAPGNMQVIGYYTLAAGAVAFTQLPSNAAQKLPKHPVPVVLLTRLAVDQSFQGKRVGESLLLDALQRALDLSAGLGIHAVEVDAVDLAAGSFYQKYGFIPLLDDPLHLYLPISTIEILLG